MLGLLAAANFLNYVDRQIVSILAQSIKVDLQLTDAQLGFLLGTAFAVLYGVAGIAVGRISDAVSRSKLMATGLALWSGMTMLAGGATGFAGLAATRIGVGVGEATANPCSHSLLSQFFPARNRTVALGVYLTGTYLGGAGALLLGGLIVQHWDGVCGRLPIGGACGVASWQAAFLIVGAPGLLLALLIANIREPLRPPRADAMPLGRLVATEFSAAVPPFTLFSLYRAGGARALGINLLLIAILAAAATLLTALTHDLVQWVAVAIGVYSVGTWGQVLSYRDRPLYKLTFGCPTYCLTLASGAMIACISAGVQVWAAPYAMRVLGVPPGKTGLYLGLAYAAAAALSVVLSGVITDRWKLRDPRAPVWMGVVGLLGPLPGLVVMMLADAPATYVAGYFAFCLFSASWSSAYAAMVLDLVLPRMRGTAAAAFSLVIIVVSAGAGPYLAGKISTMTGSLALGMISLQALVPIALVVLLLAARRLKRETEAGRRERAQAFGELV